MFAAKSFYCVAAAGLCTLAYGTLYSQELPQKPRIVETDNEFENDEAGLLRLLQRALEIAKANDSARLSDLIARMEIPNQREWFTTMYGPAKGQELSDQYQREIGKDEAQFRELLLHLSSQLGQMHTQPVSDPVRSAFKTVTPLRDFYFANWQRPKPLDGKNDPVGYFIFVDGGFRWYSLVEFARNVQPATLAKRVSPVYPAEAAAKGVYGSVELEVVIGKDGSVDIRRVLSGDPLLATAAVDAVQKWKYHPLLFDGQPTATQTTITVNFDSKH